MSNGSEHICAPHCDKPCINGWCSDSNVCICDDSFVLNDALVCTPICGGLDEICVNGTCLLPGECLCFDGFEKSINSDFICVGSETTRQEVVFRGYTRYLYVVYIVMTGIAAVVLVLLIMRRHRKVDYSVKKAGKCTKTM